MARIRERAIVFNGAMVRAILDGRKTVERRVVKPEALRVRLHRTVRSDVSMFEREELAAGPGVHPAWMNEHGAVCVVLPDGRKLGLRPGEFTWVSPLGEAGQRLWVKEDAYLAPPGFGDPRDNNARDNKRRGRLVGYVASMDAEACRCAEDYGIGRSVSVLMPRWASRLLLEVTAVRVERLRDIERAAWEAPLAEGLTVVEDMPGDAVLPCTYGVDGRQTNRTPWTAFQRYWDATKGKTNAAARWVANPWVWVIEFRRFDKAIARERVD